MKVGLVSASSVGSPLNFGQSEFKANVNRIPAMVSGSPVKRAHAAHNGLKRFTNGVMMAAAFAGVTLPFASCTNPAGPTPIEKPDPGATISDTAKGVGSVFADVAPGYEVVADTDAPGGWKEWNYEDRGDIEKYTATAYDAPTKQYTVDYTSTAKDTGALLDSKTGLIMTLNETGFTLTYPSGAKQDFITKAGAAFERDNYTKAGKLNLARPFDKGSVDAAAVAKDGVEIWNNINLKGTKGLYDYLSAKGAKLLKALHR